MKADHWYRRSAYHLSGITATFSAFFLGRTVPLCLMQCWWDDTTTTTRHNVTTHNFSFIERAPTSLNTHVMQPHYSHPSMHAFDMMTRDMLTRDGYTFIIYIIELSLSLYTLIWPTPNATSSPYNATITMHHFSLIPTDYRLWWYI